jgi:hypothetical protein
VRVDSHRCKEESSPWILNASIDRLARSLQVSNTRSSPSILENIRHYTNKDVHSLDVYLNAPAYTKQIQTLNLGNFTHIDLAYIHLVRDQYLRDVPEKYWNFVAEIYAKRLSLSPDEISGFIRSSRELTSRTKLIVNTTNGIRTTPAFNGGISVVFSRHENEPLPCEKSLDARLSRPSSEASAEIVRLTVVKETDVKNLCRELIYQAAELILQDPQIQTTYIYTSKLHYRLYRQLGVEPASIKSLGARDVLITLKRSDVGSLYELTYAN